MAVSVGMSLELGFLGTGQILVHFHCSKGTVDVLIGRLIRSD